MGCDIHMHMEYRYRGGQWQLAPGHKVSVEYEDEGERLNQISATGRNYELFAKLAGVRGEGPAARGLPDDVCSEIRKATEDSGDDHSHSWCTLEELATILKELKYSFKDKNDTCFYKWGDYSYKSEDNKPHPPDYTPIIFYGRKLKRELGLVDHIVLGAPPSEDEVDIRLVFWFDN